jgi:transposase
MTRTTKAISDEILSQCKRELKELGPSGEMGRRLQAIISAKKYGISIVSKIYGISRETFMRWLAKFKEGGSSRFKVAKGRGRRSKLSETQKAELNELVERDGATLTAKKLRLIIEERYNIFVSNVTAYRMLRSLGFSHITPRPKHYKQDEAKSEEFKKKS